MNQTWDEFSGRTVVTNSAEPAQKCLSRHTDVRLSAFKPVAPLEWPVTRCLDANTAWAFSA